MNTKTLYFLIAIALAALIGAVAINLANRPASGVSEQAKPMLAELKDHLNDVSAITLRGAGDSVLVTLKHDKDGWSVAERSAYPADTTTIRELLLKLEQATLIEQKTANPKRYADLGVDEVKDKDAKGILVEISGLAQPLKLIVGNYNGAGGGGTFVRRDGDVQSWLANGNLTVAKNVADWEKRDLTDIPSSRLRSIAITGRDGKVLKVAKEHAGDANFKVADVPKGREASSEFAANSLGSALAGLKADDAFPAKDVAPADKTVKMEYAAFDGLVVEATGWDKDGKDYAQFSARLDAAAANAQIDKNQAKAKVDYDAAVAASKKPVDDKAATDAKVPPPEVTKPLAVSDPAKDRQDKLDAANEEIAELNKTFSGWSFVLPGYKFTEMTKSMDDMLKPLESKKADAKDAAKTGAKTPVKPAAAQK